MCVHAGAHQLMSLRSELKNLTSPTLSPVTKYLWKAQREVEMATTRHSSSSMSCSCHVCSPAGATATHESTVVTAVIGEE